jgi:hypothetical protein
MTQITMEDENGEYLVDVKYTFTPGYPATRIDPAQPDDVDVTSATVSGEDAPQWVWDWLNGDLGYEYLCADAQGRAQENAEDAADHRRAMREEAQWD